MKDPPGRDTKLPGGGTMWLVGLGAAALAGDVTLCAGVQDVTTQAPRIDGMRFGGDLRLYPALAIGLQGGVALGEPGADSLTQELAEASLRRLPYSASLAQTALLVDLGWGAPERTQWAGGPHLFGGPAAHLRKDTHSVNEGGAYEVELPNPRRRMAFGFAYGAAFDLWYDRFGARLSVTDHVLVEREVWTEEGDLGLRSHLAFGLDLRARL